MCTKDKKVKEPVRSPAVSGSFYPSSKAELSHDVKLYLKNAKEFPSQDITALIVPHAGYVFSAPIAATAYKTLHKPYKNVFIIGSSHHINFNGISIYNQGDYQTPLGRVKVNTTIVEALIHDNPLITYRAEAHTKEHTLEVQLPFLQTIYGDKLQVIPIILATSEIETIKQLALSLQPYFNDDNLFVISTDLSHYPSYEDAKRVDMNILNALTKNSPKALLKAITQNENSATHNLQTSACGWASLLTLLNLSKDTEYTYEILEYKNSGDSQYGDKEKVVGYGAMRVYKRSEEFIVTGDEKKQMHQIATAALQEAILHNKRLQINPNELSPLLKKPLGAFVTLYLDSQLKGCIGRFEPDEPLYNVIIDMSIAAAKHDTRFTPVTKDELSKIKIEISLLTSRKKVNSLENIRLGKDGIYVKYGSKSGTYLPHVASGMPWSKEEFFKSCCEDKAKIATDDCKKAELYTYQAIVF